MKSLFFLFSLSNTIFGLFCIANENYYLYALLLQFVFIVIPLADAAFDAVFPYNKSVLNISVPSKLDVFFLELLILFYPLVQWSLLIFALIRIENLTDPLAFLLLTLCVGITTGSVGITYAHELIHRKNKLWHFAGNILLLSVSYLHFSISHRLQHHRYVATEQDPSSAAKNQSIYPFALKSFFSEITFSFNYEKQRASSLFSFKNNFSIGLLFLFLTYFLVIYFCGLTGFIFFLTQSLIAIFLATCINYIQHYGLRRQIRAEKPEPVSHQHSWDSNKIISNFFLLGLEKHSDHHLHVSKNFYNLRPTDKSPQLPAGYQLMLFLALFPYFWKQVMNPKVDEYLKNNPHF